MESLPVSEEGYPERGIYEHFKSTPEDQRHYQVLDFATNTETEETMVIYARLTDDSCTDRPRLYVRPLKMFTEEVELDGKILPRFRYIGPES